MTETLRVLAILAAALPLLTGVAVQAIRPGRTMRTVVRTGALATAGVALALAVLALAGHELHGRVILVDTAGGVFLPAIAVVGCLSALLSPSYLETASSRFFRSRPQRWYYLALFAFWSVLLAVPLVGNLGLAWPLVEATTVASGLLVVFGGSRSSLEAGWKYLVLTTLGLTVALVGIVMLFVASSPHGGALSALDWTRLRVEAASMPHETVLVAFLLVLAGLAAKIGWAPVHNWLPDAHSEAPAPASALLSAALLPTVILVAWRTSVALAPGVGRGNTSAVFLGFGLVSLAVAVPFLWRPLAWKRLLAYSSLEHMGVIALGIGFGGTVALAGVVLHVSAHALAKSLGFYTAIPLFRVEPSAAGRALLGVGRRDRTVAGAVGVSLGSLSGLPPSPLFFSEVLVLLGGFLTGHGWAAAIAALLLALGFLGLSRALIEGILGRRRSRRGEGHGTAWTLPLTVATGVALLALSAAAYALPASDVVAALTRWAG